MISPTSLLSWQRRHDPDSYALHRAVRVAVVAPTAFALAFEVIGDPVVATFAAFGSFAMLLFVDFPGDWTVRLTSYLLLVGVGAVLIALGTLASRSRWLAVAGMTLAGFAVLFAGLLSAAIAAAGRAALLTFILPVTLPGGPGDIPPRIAGFALAAALSIPAALLLWPPRQHDELRRHAGGTCAALAAVIDAQGAGDAERAAAAWQDAATSLAALRRSFRGTVYRPVGLTTGSRALIRLVDELEWLASIVSELRVERMRGWPPLARDATHAAADVLRACAEPLQAARRPRFAGAGERGSGRPELRSALRALVRERDRVGSEVRALLDPRGNCAADLPYQGHEISYAAELIGATVEWAADADARPVLDRVLGRPATHAESSPISPAVRIAASHVERHSVWLQNSVRGALGLGLAVLLVESFGSQHAFWAVLGALSVLRSNALSTGSTVLRALLGTVIGFAIGGLLVVAIGTSTAALWIALPIVVFVAAYAPEAISFAAGQAAFTVVVLVLFNIIQPVGWKVGIVRVEDVAIGCAASIVVGVLLWPRGASAAISTALSEAYRVGAAYLQAAVEHTLRRGPDAEPELRSSLAAGRRLDDALRQYLAERGAKNVPLAALTAAANGATRLRLAGQAIEALGGSPGDTASSPGGGRSSADQVLLREAQSVHDWYRSVADALDPRARAGRTPQPRSTDRIEEVIDALHRDLGSGGGARPSGPDAGQALDPRQATRLLWTSIYLQDMRVLETRLSEPVAAIPRRRGSGLRRLSGTR